MGKPAYGKPFLSFDEQIDKLEERGLVIDDRELAKTRLQSISYYRLRGYTYPFQDEDENFIGGITFEQIYSLYCFDRKLRNLAMDALEKIEVALKTQMIYQWARTNGANWYEDPALYDSKQIYFEGQLQSVYEVNMKIIVQTKDYNLKKDHVFITHYYNKYDNSYMPPAWMMLEVLTFGQISKLFKALKHDAQLKENCPKKLVSAHFGIDDTRTTDNWINALSLVRNICAHHEKLWNFKLSDGVFIPKGKKGSDWKNFPVSQFTGSDENKARNKLIFGILCCIKHMLDNIAGNHDFSGKLADITDICPLNQELVMGFPENWRESDFWQPAK